jgi:hypothetical protein
VKQFVFLKPNFIRNVVYISSLTRNLEKMAMKINVSFYRMQRRDGSATGQRLMYLTREAIRHCISLATSFSGAVPSDKKVCSLIIAHRTG